jgi:hypothetical protein
MSIIGSRRIGSQSLHNGPGTGDRNGERRRINFEARASSTGCPRADHLGVCGAIHLLGRLHLVSLHIFCCGMGCRQKLLKRHTRPIELPAHPSSTLRSALSRVRRCVRTTTKSFRADAAPGKLCILIAEPGWPPPSRRGKPAEAWCCAWLPGVGCFKPS